MRKIISITEKYLSRIIFVAQVTSLSKAKNNEYIIKIRRLSDGVEMDNVRIVGLGIGNARGIVKYPQIDDLGIVVSLFGERFWLGNISDIYSKQWDQFPDLKEGLLIQSQEAGSYIIFTNNDNIEIKHKDGMKIIFKNSYIRIINKDKYGIEVTSDGKVNIYGTEVNFHNTPMD